MQLAAEHGAQSPENAAANYRKGLNSGLRKVMSRMGISALASYRNSHLFETVGLDHDSKMPGCFAIVATANGMRPHRSSCASFKNAEKSNRPLTSAITRTPAE
jgi:glutamate synthase domain-containing protein 2